MRKIFKSMQGCLMSVVLATTMIPVPAYAQEVDTHPTEKTETVYCVLNENGSVSQTIVSNKLHDEDGIHNISEELQLKNVKNTSGKEKPSVKGNTYTWNTMDTDVYYQGETSQQLPVSVRVEYYLNGKEISSNDLKGKKGHLKCVIHLISNISKDMRVDGKNVRIHPSYLCAGAMILNGDSFSKASVSQGEVIQEGKDKIVTFATVPGLENTLKDLELDKIKDSYKISDTITMEADVKNCDIKSILLGMTNEFRFDALNDISELSELTGGINQLVSAAVQLEDGSSQLYQGTSKLIEESKPLTSASGQIKTLAQSTTVLNNGATQIKEGVMNYVDGSKSLNKGLHTLNQGSLALGGSQKIAEGMDALADGLSRYESSLKQTQQTLQNNTQVKELAGIIQSSKQQIEGMGNVIANSKSIVENLQGSLSSLQQVIGYLSDACKEVQQADGIMEQNNEIVDQYNVIIDGSKSSIQAAITILEDALGNEGLSENQKATIQGQIGALSEEYASLIELSSLEEANLTKLTQDLSGIQDILSKLDLSSLRSQISTLEQALQGANSVLDSMAENLQKAKGDMDALDLVGMVNQLTQYAETFSSNSKILSEYMNSLNDGIGQLRQGIAEASEGSETLNSYNDQLVQGVIALQQGTSELEGNKDQFNSMADGLTQLSSAFEQLNTGAKTLNEGCERFNAEGMRPLKEKLDLTTNEINRLVDVFNEIVKLNNEHTDFIGSPDGSIVKTRYILRTE